MDSFWKSALEAAEKAKTVAKQVSQKGMEFAEATAEEAGKRLKDLGLNESISGNASKQKGPTQEELEAYGITQTYIDFIRSLNYTTFREHPAAASNKEQQQESESAQAPLNPWQVRHAMLVVRTVKEVNELRYVLCPRYLTDQQFWEVYFSLARTHLPDIAFLYSDGDPLPPVSIIKDGDDNFMSFHGIGNQLRTLSTKFQAAATAAAHAGAESAGVELSTIFSSSKDGASSGAAQTAASGGDEAPKQATLLEADPDLEEYLRGAAGSDRDEEDENGLGGEGGIEEADGGDGEGGDDDLDLDKYLNELSAEVEDVDENGDASEVVDYDAVLRELEEEGNKP